MIAFPNKCSPCISAIAANFKTSFFEKSLNVDISVISGFPTVNVPVLSRITVSILPAFSMLSPFLNIIPFTAALPDETIKDAGLAIPSAHGHAIIKTLTRTKSEYVRPIPPIKYQKKNEKFPLKLLKEQNMKKPYLQALELEPSL